jgi:caa(3)-type oxidase subunit IV
MNPKHPSKKIFALTWIALVLFHFLILGSAYLNLKFANTPIIAALVFIQMMLIILFFMEVRYSARLIWLFVATGFFWLLIQFTLVAGDYLTRGWH